MLIDLNRHWTTAGLTVSCGHVQLFPYNTRLSEISRQMDTVLYDITMHRVLQQRQLLARERVP